MESRYEELKSAISEVKEPKKSFILSLLKDFCWLEEQIDALRRFPRYVIDEKNPKRQAKLPVHDMLKDYQAQKDDIATKVLRSLDGEAEGQSELARILAGFDK
jgi:hypothetical protein